MSDTYTEKIKFSWGTQKHMIKEKKKGTLIYQEVRRNHVENMVEVIDGEEIPLIDHEYLVFDIPDDVDYRHFDQFPMDIGFSVRWFPGWTEIACHHPQVYASGIIEKLRELGYIKYILKEIPNEDDQYPYYVNAKGWRVFYNAINTFRTSIKQGGFKMINRFEEEIEESSVLMNKEDKKQ